MRTDYSSRRARLFALLSIVLLAVHNVQAGSATWNLNPISSDWNTAANWTPNTVPNSPTDIATFAVSNTTDVKISMPTTLDSITFNPGASSYTIMVLRPVTLTLSGGGVINNSGVAQHISTVIGEGCVFTGTADAGALCVYTHPGTGSFEFEDSATAGCATFLGEGAGGLTIFSDNSSAANATFSVLGGFVVDQVVFNDSSSAADGVFDTLPSPSMFGGGGILVFNDNSTASNATITNHGHGLHGNGSGSTSFYHGSTAADAHITNEGSFQVLGGHGITNFGGFLEGFTTSAGNAIIVNEGGNIANTFGGETSFYGGSGGSDGGNATITSESGLVPGAFGGVTLFSYGSNGGNSTLIANGDSDSISAGSIRFEHSSVGGTARVILSGTGKLDISNHAGQVTVGSVEGEGAVFLGSNSLGIGSNNLSTSLAAIIQDGGVGGGIGGSLTKVGTGLLTLTGANIYTGATHVSGGSLIVANSQGSGTGTGAVTVSSGTLGGSGIISGAATIGTGAFLAPAGGTQTRATLSIQSGLAFSGNSTYTYTFKAKRQQAKTDKVVANGVTINSGATFSISGQTQGNPTQGLVLTVISNTAATPIAGTFSNLADGAIIAVNGTNFQASYEGGDGNDLTLTVVP